MLCKADPRTQRCSALFPWETRPKIKAGLGRKHHILPHFTQELQCREPSGSTYATDHCPPWRLLMSFCTNLKMLPLVRACPAKTGAVGSAAVRRRHASQKLFLQKVVPALSIITAELEMAVLKRACALKPTLSCSLEDPLTAQTIA